MLSGNNNIVIVWAYLASMTNYLEIFYSGDIHALVFGNDDLNPVPSVLNGTTKSCDHVPQTSHLGYRGHLTSNVHNMVSRPEWRIISNSMRIRISQYTVLLILTTIYSSCAPAADISAQSQNARAQLEREYNEFIFEFLPLRCHWCFERVKQVSNKILHLFLRDGTVRCWGKESSCGPQSIAPHHQLQLYQQPTTNSCEL